MWPTPARTGSSGTRNPACRQCPRRAWNFAWTNRIGRPCRADSRSCRSWAAAVPWYSADGAAPAPASFRHCCPSPGTDWWATVRRMFRCTAPESRPAWSSWAAIARVWAGAGPALWRPPFVWRWWSCRSIGCRCRGTWAAQTSAIFPWIDLCTEGGHVQFGLEWFHWSDAARLNSQDFVSPGDKRRSQKRIFGSVSSTTLPWPCCVLSAVSAITAADFGAFASFSFSSSLDTQ